MGIHADAEGGVRVMAGELVGVEPTLPTPKAGELPVTLQSPAIEGIVA